MRRGVALTTIAVVCIGHGWLTWLYCGGGAGLASPMPFLSDDHPYVYYNALVEAEALRQSGTTAAYDPVFMAGYVNSFISSSNPVAPLLLLFFDPSHAGRAYKLSNYLAMLAMPVLLALGAWQFRSTAGECAVCLVFWFVLTWTGFNHNYFRFGMVAFLVSAAWIFLLGGVFSRYLECPSWPRALLLGATAGLAWAAHTTVPVVAAPPFLLSLLIHRRYLGLAALAQLAAATLLCVLLNLFWLAPVFLVWSTLGEPPKFFVNPNVAERLLEIVTRPEKVYALIAGMALLGSVRTAKRLGSPTRLIVATMLAWLFFLTYPAGWFRPLDILQPGRNETHLYTWLCLPAAHGLYWLIVRRSLRPIVLVGLLIAIPIVNSVQQLTANIASLRESQVHLPVELPRKFAAVATFLRTHCAPGTRVFFEDRNAGIPDVVDPFGDLRPSPLIALASGCEFIGGPYLKTHYRANATQFGDGRLLGHRLTDRDWFQRHAVIYAARYLVGWSPATLAFCEANRDLLIPRAAFGGLVAFEIARPAAPWESIGIRLRARLNHLDVTVPAGTSGRVILPYHYAPGLSATPATRLAAVRQGDDPVPFIALLDPPSKLTIHFSPWPRRGMTQ